MPRGGRGGSAGEAQEPAAEPRHAADAAGVGHGAVVGRGAGRRRARGLHGRLRQVLRGAHALLQPEAPAGQVALTLHSTQQLYALYHRLIMLRKNILLLRTE